MSLDAARQGLGVALIPDIVVANTNTQGLVVAQDFRVHSAGEYYMLSLHKRCHEHAIVLFRDWVKEQFQQD
jgi:LysR family glycine cleavage system transcriptional activator